MTALESNEGVEETPFIRGRFSGTTSTFGTFDNHASHEAPRNFLQPNRASTSSSASGRVKKYAFLLVVTVLFGTIVYSLGLLVASLAFGNLDYTNGHTPQYVPVNGKQSLPLYGQVKYLSTIGRVTKYKESGFIPLKVNLSHNVQSDSVSRKAIPHAFYLLVPSFRSPQTDPITFYFGGGPNYANGGQQSAFIAGFSSILPHTFSQPVPGGELKLGENRRPWNKKSNLVIVDVVPGVGFSQCFDSSIETSAKPLKCYYPVNSQEVMQYMKAFLDTFFDRHPEYSSRDLILAGAQGLAPSITLLAQELQLTATQQGLSLSSPFELQTNQSDESSSIEEQEKGEVKQMQKQKEKKEKEKEKEEEKVKFNLKSVILISPDLDVISQTKSLINGIDDPRQKRYFKKRTRQCLKATTLSIKVDGPDSDLGVLSSIVNQMIIHDECSLLVDFQQQSSLIALTDTRIQPVISRQDVHVVDMFKKMYGSKQSPLSESISCETNNHNDDIELQYLLAVIDMEDLITKQQEKANTKLETAEVQDKLTEKNSLPSCLENGQHACKSGDVSVLRRFVFQSVRRKSKTYRQEQFLRLLPAIRLRLMLQSNPKCVLLEKSLPKKFTLDIFQTPAEASLEIIISSFLNTKSVKQQLFAAPMQVKVSSLKDREIDVLHAQLSQTEFNKNIAVAGLFLQGDQSRFEPVMTSMFQALETTRFVILGGLYDMVHCPHCLEKPFQSLQLWSNPSNLHQDQDKHEDDKIDEDENENENENDDIKDETAGPVLGFNPGRRSKFYFSSNKRGNILAGYANRGKSSHPLGKHLEFVFLQGPGGCDLLRQQQQATSFVLDRVVKNKKVKGVNEPIPNI